MSYCPGCGTPAAADDRFCANCGNELLPSEKHPQVDDAAPTVEHEVPPAPAATRGPAPVQAAIPTPPQAIPYAVQPHAPQGGTPVGLIAGLVAAGLLALAGITAVLLIALSGNDGPEAATAAATPVTTTAAPAVTVIERTVTTRVRRSRSSSGSRSVSRSSSASSASSAPIAEISSRSTSGTSDRAQIRSVVERHWSLVEQGSYDAAFALLAPGTQDRAAWMQDKRTDRPSEASITLGQPTLNGATSATVPVLNLHTEANSGCNNWSGHYRMTKLGGTWKIEKAKISPSPC